MAVAIWGGSAAAQPLEAEPDEVICVSIAARWYGGGDDVRAIEQVPVPQSFRRPFEAVGTCARMQLIEADLITWHLRFGSEHSVVPALEYLARDYLRDRPSPERYLGLLKRAARDVEGQNRPIQLLESFVETRENYVFLGTQYLRAAEEFKSRDLLEIAERYLGAAIAAGELLTSLETDPGERDHDLDLDTFKTDDLELRSAVLHVQLAASPPAVAKAEAILRSKERPFYPLLAGAFIRDGDDFCDLRRAGFSEVEEAARIACDDHEAALQERMVSFFVSRAMLDLADVEDLPGPYGDSFASAVGLLEAERFHESSRCCRLSSEEDLLRLHLAAAEAFRWSASLPRRRGSGYSSFFDALEELEAAERLAQPFDAPGRFRRIAQSWLQMFEQLETAMQRDERGSLRLESPEFARHAAYLTHTLANLDAIARGAE